MEKTILDILNTMAVPEQRKDLTAHNLRWLTRNLPINNQNHSELSVVMHLIKNLLTQKGN